MSYSDFKAVVKEKLEEKYQRNQTNFELTYLGKGLVEITQIWK